jgi:hypothetical protein
VSEATPPNGAGAANAGVIETAQALATDAVCGQVVAAFEVKGIESIVLKGPTTAEWLYPDEVRGYADADLLIRPERVSQAAAVLERLGFTPFERYVSPHGHPWLRGSDGAEVDLHVTLWGPHRPAEVLWEELQGWVETRQIGGTRVRTLNLPGRALHTTRPGLVRIFDGLSSGRPWRPGERPSIWLTGSGHSGRWPTD